MPPIALGSVHRSLVMTMAKDRWITYKNSQIRGWKECNKII